MKTASNAPTRTAAAAPPVTPSKRAPRQQEDSFKTPSGSSAARASHSTAQNGGDANGAGEAQASGTQFAYAPSPSRLRALAASRSFSGSPNKKGGLAGLEVSSSSYTATADVPPNLGKTFVLPPTIDTPRTKAKRWLAGDAVSPPVKLRYNTQTSSQTNGNNGAGLASTSAAAQGQSKRPSGSKADFWQQVEQRRSATPADDAAGGINEDGAVNGISQDLGDDDDFLVPSPVKPAPIKSNGKGKQRQRVDLFGNPAEEASLPSNLTNVISRKSASNLTLPVKKVTATPITSFFSAKPPISRSSSNGEEPSKKGYVAGPSKAKKRTIAAAAIVPTVSEDFDKIEDPDVAPVQAEATSRSKEKQGNPVEQPQAARAAEGATGRTKRPRKEVTPTQVNGDAGMQAEDEYEDAYDPEVLEAIEAQEDDYETRDLSDEYEEYKPRKRSITPAMLAQDSREASSAPLDESIDPDLVSLLSLKASPVKNRLAKLHKKREDTYRKLLLEPTYIMESKRQITGLEDLEDEERRRREDELEETAERPWSTELAQDDTFGIQKALIDGEHEEDSDDDWASEAEGWKDLSDGEMPEDSF